MRKNRQVSGGRQVKCLSWVELNRRNPAPNPLLNRESQLKTRNTLHLSHDLVLNSAHRGFAI